jgi:hypothetical protein
MIRAEKMFALGDVLGPQMARLAAQAQQRASLADVIKAALTPQIRPHVLGASWRKTTLVVMVDSGAWTAQVRFAEEDIRRHLKEANEPDCERLWVRVVQPPSVAVSQGAEQARQ